MLATMPPKSLRGFVYFAILNDQIYGLFYGYYACVV
jgi:hypothetical protein